MSVVPRLIGVAEAARYCGLSPAGFRAAVTRGVFPGPVPGLKKYDTHALNRRLDRLSGIIDAVETKPKLSAYDEWKASLGA